MAGFPAFHAVNTIEVEFDPTSGTGGLNCKGHAWFAEQGDSGSLLVDQDGFAIGLVHSVPNPADPTTPANATATACHILPVLDTLGICIPSAAGTSYGSCAATDGSGTATTPPPASGSGGGGGFHHANVDGEMRAMPPVPDRVPADADARARLDATRAAFDQLPGARDLRATFELVRREVGYLVRNARPVTVAWHRAQGPAWFAHVLNHLRGETDSVPFAIAGVTRKAMLERMAEVLSAHGSNPLRDAIARHRDALMPILTAGADVQECMALLRAAEEADDAAILHPAGAAGRGEP